MTRTFYNSFHKRSNVQNKIIKRGNFTYRNIIFFLKPYTANKKLDVLDFGCGVGTLSLYFAAKGHFVTGVDASSRALDIFEKSAKSIGLLDVVEIKTNLDKISKKYDLVICSEVIEHIQNDLAVVSRLGRLLKKDGLLFISVPSLNSPLYKLGLLKKFDMKVGHLRRYSLVDLKKFVSKDGLQIIKYRKMEGIFRNALFTLPFLNWAVKFIKGPISNAATFVDNISLFMFGESSIYILYRHP